MQPLTSSMLTSIDYNEATQTLQVTMRNGNIYQYANVPRETAREFANAESAGTYFNTQIKPLYAFEKLEAK